MKRHITGGNVQGEVKKALCLINGDTYVWKNDEICEMESVKVCYPGF